MTVELEATEESLLMLETERDPKTKWTNDAIRTVVLMATFLVFGNMAEVFKAVSSVRLLELGICREYYLQAEPSVIDSHGNIPERLCKLPRVQRELASLRGTIGALEATVGFVLAIPYGLIINRIGERALGALNLVGYLLGCTWFLMVCYFWNTFPIWAAVFAPLFRTIGGSAPVMASVLYSLTAKHVPEANRSLCFFFFGAVQLLSEIFAIAAVASLLDRQFLFTPVMVSFGIAPICLITLFLVPRHKPTKPAPGSEAELNGANRPKLFDSIRSSSRLMSKLLRDKNLLILLATIPVACLRAPLSEIWLQYIPKKFDLSLASASRIITIQLVESLILLILVLPGLKEIAQVKFRVHSNKVDLRIVQCGFLIMTFGCLMMAFSQTLVAFILGFIVYTLGISTRPALQSVLTDLVSREHIAVLYTVIAVSDGIGAATGALVLNRSLALAIGWENRLYLGLPFIIAAACYVFGFGGSLFAGHSALKDTKIEGEESPLII